LQAFIEFEGNTPVFVEDYNSVRNGKHQFPVIADPQAAELNQGWVSFSAIANTSITVGLQEIKYDNQRFVGTVPWRQLEQTFDSATLLNKSIDNLEFKTAYIWNVKTIVSRDVNMSSPVFNLTYTIPLVGKVIGYAYLLDYSGSNSGTLRFSTQSR